MGSSGRRKVIMPASFMNQLLDYPLKYKFLIQLIVVYDIVYLMEKFTKTNYTAQ